MLPNDVKLVIWDLDDTFWSGTLAEGEITPIAANHDIVITLAKRGIMSSICSKNNFDEAAARLTTLGVWDYFIFPKIEFGPKGANIAAIIETAGLRAENILFIDDNRLNLEEARQFAPGLMTADPLDILPGLLALPQLAGKNDAALTRLNQYKNLEVKAVERAGSKLGHEDFLRQCGITVTFDYEVEKNFDRLIELANRTNQLNFTKSRFETPEAVAGLRALLGSYGVTAGLIRVADKYGDYGITGYFVLHRIYNKNNLLHFAFSCRTMNMGVEQYVYERLQKPDIKVVPPVANPISSFETVDWISEGHAGTHQLGHATSNKKLLLIGGCELLQLASMCSSDREEFVNAMRDKWPVRFDDACFITSDRQLIKKDKAIEKLNFWNYEDTKRFDTALAQSEIVIAALFTNLGWAFFETPSGAIMRISEDSLKRNLRKDGIWFVKNFRHVKFTTKDKLDLIAKALAHLAAHSRPGARRFALGVNTKKLAASQALSEAGWPGCLQRETRQAAWLQMFNALPQPQRYCGARHLFNRFLQNYCARHDEFTFIDVDNLITEDDIFDADPDTGVLLPDHFSRRGYIAIAGQIAACLSNASVNQAA
jgi:FkbH-like protein